jgi:HSP20 family protein
MFTIKRRLSPIESVIESQIKSFTPFEELFRDVKFTNNNVKSNVVNQESFQEIQMCIPGIDKKLINISLDDFILKVKYKINYEESEDSKKYSLREFGISSFDKIFKLPKDSNLDKITSKYDNGILYINVPKSDSAKNKKRTVEIK